MPDIAELVLRFLTVGALAFGGGGAALPLVERFTVAETGWLTPRQFAIGVGFAYATPGPILILAAFVGYYVAGVPGALAGTFAVFAVPVALAAGSAGVVAAIEQVRALPGVRQLRRCRSRRAPCSDTDGIGVADRRDPSLTADRIGSSVCRRARWNIAGATAGRCGSARRGFGFRRLIARGGAYRDLTDHPRSFGAAPPGGCSTAIVAQRQGVFWSLEEG